MEIKQRKGLQRNTIDKYYTKPNVVEICINHIKKNIIIQSTDLIIEPSAGNGSFINELKTITENTLFYDIEPEHPEIIQQDYLKCNTTNWTDNFKKIHIIGNPPFGRQSSTAIQFIKKSCSFCDSLSFILPKSFKKDSLKRSFPPHFHLIFELDLPEKSFLVDGEEYNVESVFQIWEKRDMERPAIQKLEPLNFRFVEKTENPDFSFRRVGVYAGKIDLNIIEKSVQSHYFIQFTQSLSSHSSPLEFEKKELLIDILKKIEFSHNNTVGPRSISKQEVIREFNKYL